MVSMKTLLLLLLMVMIELEGSSRCETTDLFFPGFKGSTAENLTLTGVAEVWPTGILRLTNDSRRMTGHAFAAAPVRMKTSNNDSNGTSLSFSTTFAFSVVPEYPKLGGHGLAFAVSASKDLYALPSQYLGLLNATDNTGNASNHLFAVEFDTVQDFEFGDISDNHVGINLNSMNSTLASTLNFSLNGRPIQAWIDYDAPRTTLNVTVSPFTQKPPLPLLSLNVDLSPVLREFMYVGFSASTGLLASSHYILGWSFRTGGGPPRHLDLSSLPHLPGPKKSHAAAAIAGSAAAIFLLIAGGVAAAWLFFSIKNADPIEAWERELGPHRFTYADLRKATSGFGESALLGRGGFGRVYRGNLRLRPSDKAKTPVAVKRVSHESRQGIREFVAEISTIGRLRHRNLVQLMGWCRRRADLILVYEYMENGSLEKFLFDDPVRVLTWEQRVNVVNGVASALLYLHEGFDQVVIHRDVKASNILLDADLNGRLGDFGLAKLHDHGANMSTTRVVGTMGYLAPELPRTGKATTGSDVYAFGALLLEVMAGRRPIEPKAPPEELVLVDWVWELYREERVMEAVDKRLGGKFDAREAETIAKLGLMCSNNNLEARPTMRHVVRYLEGEIQVPHQVLDPFGLSIERKDRVIAATTDGFDDFVHSFPTSSFDGLSKSHSFGGGGAALGTSFNSMSTSPMSLLRD